jgi:integrase
MGSLKFRTRTTGARVQVYARVTLNRNDRWDCKTGIIVNSDFFNNSTGELKRLAAFTNYNEAKKKLNTIRTQVEDALTLGNIKARQDVIDVMNPVSNDNPLLTKVFEDYVIYSMEGKEYSITESTAKSYRSTRNRVLKFEKKIKRKYGIQDVNLDFKESFIKWARNKNGGNYADDTWGKSIKHIKTVCEYAKTKLRIEVDDSIFTKEVRKTKETVKDIHPHLSLEELKRIESMELDDSMDNVRDWLIISCFTALRVSDLMRVDTKMIERTKSGLKAIRIRHLKTGIEVLTPILPPVQRIMDKRLGQFPKPIAEQYYNRELKKLGKEAKLTEKLNYKLRNGEDNNRIVRGIYEKWELMTSHIGRRSFCTNMYGEMDNFSIMLVSGHKTIHQFLEYIGKKEDKHIDKFEKLAEKWGM